MVRRIRDKRILAFVCWEDERARDKFLGWIDSPEVAERERKVGSRVVDGTPQVDDLEPIFEQLFCVLGSMAADASLGGCWGLINVHSWDRVAVLRRVLSIAWLVTTNGYRLFRHNSHDSQNTYCGQRAPRA